MLEQLERKDLEKMGRRKCKVNAEGRMPPDGRLRHVPVEEFYTRHLRTTACTAVQCPWHRRMFDLALRWLRSGVDEERSQAKEHDKRIPKSLEGREENKNGTSKVVRINTQ